MAQAERKLTAGELAVLHNATGADFGFGPGPQEEFDEASADFTANFDTIYMFPNGQGYRVEADLGEAQAAQRDTSGAFDADFDVVGGGGGNTANPAGSSDTNINPETDPLVEYVKLVKQWESGVEFVNDGDKVESVRNRRLALADTIATKFPERIVDPRLKGFEAYLNADLLYLDRPDPSSTDYVSFARERDALRRELFKGKPVLTAQDYETIAGRTQTMIADKSFIKDQYDMLDLRREAALEHFDDHRFIIGVYRSPRGLMDELLVDFDRRDLLATRMSDVDATRSKAQADVFVAHLEKCLDRGQNPAEMVQNFQMLREVGLQVRHNQRAVTAFADRFPEDGVGMEIGLAALDNVRWGEGLFQEWQKGLTKEQKAFIVKHEGPAAAFVVARERFEAQVLRGDAGAADSFAVMERAASVIGKRRDQIRKLEEISGKNSVDNIAAFHILAERHRDEALTNVAAVVDQEVMDKMGDKLITAGVRAGSAEVVGKAGDVYELTMGPDTALEVVDGSHVRLATNAADLEAGKGLVVRIDGILTPPEGVSTKSGKIDAGLAAKKHLEGVITRHGVAGSGMILNKLETGEQVLSVKMPTGEDLGLRMIRDGYALPSMEAKNATRREYMAKQSEGNARGLWAEGFPPMDHSWRHEKKNPELTWKDRRVHLVRNVTQSLCTSHQQVYQKLSRSETRLFALPLEKWSASGKIDDEIMKILRRNPSRLLDVYGNNMEILEDLRKRKDSLTQEEKYAHDQLAMGRRAVGQALVDANLLDERKFRKDTHPFMSRSGLEMSMKGVRAVADAALTATDATVQSTKKAAKRGSSGLLYMLNEAMS